MNKALKTLKISYYLVYVAAIIAASSGYFLLKANWRIDPSSELGIAVNSILIILIIGSIPLTLWLFNKKTKVWAKLESEEEKLQKYQKGALWRIVLMGAGMVLGVVFFYVLGIKSMIFCAGIATIGLFFCKPDEAKIILELELEDETE